MQPIAAQKEATRVQMAAQQDSVQMQQEMNQLLMHQAAKDQATLQEVVNYLKVLTTLAHGRNGPPSLEASNYLPKMMTEDDIVAYLPTFERIVQHLEE